MKDKAKVNKFKVRNFSQFSADCFNTELSQVDWNAIFETKSCDMNDLFSSFYNKFNKLVNKHAKQFSKPWKTQGLLTSIKIKNKLYASGDIAKYKMYRNKACSLTHTCKKQYYLKFFDSNLTNMKKELRRKELIVYLHVNQKEINPSFPLKILRNLAELPETLSV